MSVVRLYLPIEADNYQRAERLITREFADFVGGWTQWRASGGWVDGDGHRVIEPVMIIEGVGDYDPFEPSAWAYFLALSVWEITGEDAVLAVADGEKVLVS